MPTDGYGTDAEERCDGGHGEALEFVHHDDSSAARRQVVECAPDDRPDQKGPFWVIVLDGRVTQVEFVALPDRFFAPLISSDVNEYANQPCLFIPQSVGNGFGRTGSLQERLLNEIQGIIGAGNETPGEAVQPVCMRLEQSGQSIGLPRQHRRRAHGRLFAHTLLNV